MTGFASSESGQAHNSEEFKNLWTCQKIIRDWSSNSTWESYDVIPVLYTALHRGERHVPATDDAPKLAEVVRTTEAHLSGSPENLFPDSRHVYLLTSKYSTTLDNILRYTPKTVEKTIADAALAYYVFDRIHPFPDGNGRLGRMIVKRIFKSGDLKDPIFHDQSWYGNGRSDHLDTLEKVDETNNLSHLEAFLAESVIGMYDPIRDFFKHRQIARFAVDARRRSGNNIKNKTVQDLWDGFKDIDIYGNMLSVEK